MQRLWKTRDRAVDLPGREDRVPRRLWRLRSRGLATGSRQWCLRVYSWRQVGLNEKSAVLGRDADASKPDVVRACWGSTLKEPA